MQFDGEAQRKAAQDRFSRLEAMKQEVRGAMVRNSLGF
jgi:hypothetical protein